MKLSHLRFIGFGLILSCSHLMPDNWRAFEGEIPQLKALVISAVESSGFSPYDSANRKSQVTSEWKYSQTDSLHRQRQRVTVTWEFNALEGAIVIYVRHEAQNIETDIGLGLQYRATSPDNNLESQILEDLSKRILNSNPDSF
ncbi:MAG TPA: hypothetical protein EYN66_07605 [Myxococcales bacterium]|nr:hypothetical protein [Myxococcales bacterium]